MTNPIPEYQHLHPNTIPLLGRSKKARIEYISAQDHFQHSKQLLKKLEVMERIIMQSPGKRRSNVKIIGDPGLGKTSLLAEIQNKYPADYDPTINMMCKPIVIFSMTAITKCEEFCSEIEKQLGVPKPLGKMPPTVRIGSHVAYMNKVQVRLAAFDEFQDLMNILSKTRSQLVQLVKLFANLGRFPICVAGSSNSTAVLGDCKHMQARFRTTIELLPWGADDDFATWFFGLISRYPLHKPSKIFDRHTLHEIIARSGGCTDFIVSASRTCAMEAIISETESIDRNRLFQLLV